jgi:hypothetical protein
LKSDVTLNSGGAPSKGLYSGPASGLESGGDPRVPQQRDSLRLNSTKTTSS